MGNWTRSEDILRRLGFVEECPGRQYHEYRNSKYSVTLYFDGHVGITYRRSHPVYFCWTSKQGHFITRTGGCVYKRRTVKAG